MKSNIYLPQKDRFRKRKNLKLCQDLRRKREFVQRSEATALEEVRIIIQFREEELDCEKVH